MAGKRHDTHIMKRVLLLSAMGCLLGAACTLGATAEDTAAFKKKATELTKEKTTQAERLVELHRFVRDDITQTKTEYG